MTKSMSSDWEVCPLVCLDAAFVRWRKGEENTVPTVRRGPGSKMLWERFAASGTLNLVQVHGVMKKNDYADN